MKLKMDFIFNFLRRRAALPLAGALLALAGSARTAPAPRSAAGTDGGDGQRLVALVDYIAGDYASAVDDAGQVLVQSEYEEQQRFAEDARRLAKGLLGPAATADDPLARGLARLESLVDAKAAPAVVARASRTAREGAVGRFGLRTMPAERPSLPGAEAPSAPTFPPWPGATGEADAERAHALDPRPARFRDPQRLGELSPYRIYNALTFGVPGTAMASFDSLSAAERWSLAFFVFRLGHQGETIGEPTAMTLADLSARTDREILDRLRGEGRGDEKAALAYLRREAAFTEPPAGVGIDRTRMLLRRAVATYEAGRPEEADRQVLDAYLQGFEPLEPRLRARDATGTTAVEAGFHGLRAAMSRGEDPPRVRVRGEALDRRIAEVGEGRQPAVPF